MDHAGATLAAFAKHTRHSLQDESPSKLAQKWLALHVQSAPAALVYTHLAPDYALVNLRTFDPPLSAYTANAAPDPATFVYIMKNGYPRTTPIVEFGAFRDEHFPKPVGQEAWVDYRRDTHWKERAYYMAVQCGTPYALVEAIHYEDVVPPNTPASYVHKDHVAAMYARLTRHARLYPAQAYGIVDEIGALIKQIALPATAELAIQEEQSVQGVGDRGPPSVNNMTDATNATDESIINMKMDFSAELVSPRQPLPVDCSVYRKAACLPPSFQTTKLIKQMILARVGADAAGAASILGRWQKELAPRSTVDDATWAALETHIVVNPAATSDLDTPALREMHVALYRKQYQKPGSVSEFVRAALAVYAKDAALRTEAEAAYVKKYPIPDPSLIKAVVNL